MNKEVKRLKHNAYMRKRRREDRESMLVVSRAHYSRNKDTINAKRRERRANDPEYRERQRKQSRKRYESEDFRKDAIRRSKEWREANPERYKDSLLRTNYGISLVEWRAMLEAQGGACAICRVPEGEKRRRMHVDHDHKTGLVRGLLCQHCNTAIGLLRDDPAVAIRAAEYLKPRLTAVAA